MRGKDTIRELLSSVFRITPAYAGKSFSVEICLFGNKDHPRLCGEKADFILSAGNCSGSPPPMRGKVPTVGIYKTPVGITPAYAGKSFPRCIFPQNHRDHPRLCGEKRYIYIKIFSNSGSPPPMRGKAENEAFPVVQPRITPAYAGKSVICGGMGIRCGDHPRLCGEKDCV